MKRLLIVALTASMLCNGLLLLQLQRAGTSVPARGTPKREQRVLEPLQSEERRLAPSEAPALVDSSPQSSKTEQMLAAEILRLHDELAVVRTLHRVTRDAANPIISWEEEFNEDARKEMDVSRALLAVCDRVRRAAGKEEAVESLGALARELGLPPAEAKSFIRRTMGAVDDLRMSDAQVERERQEKRNALLLGVKNPELLSEEEGRALDALETERARAGQLNLRSAILVVTDGMEQKENRFAFFRAVLPDLICGLSDGLRE